MQDIKNLLTGFGFTEGVDYTLVDQILLPVEKTRPLDPEMWTKEGEDDIFEEPLIDDGEGNMIFDVSWTYVEATTETYVESLPTLDSLLESILETKDVALLINEFLVGKTRSENDSLNLAKLWTGGWGMVTPPPSRLDLYNLIDTVEAKQQSAQAFKTKIENGKIVRKICESMLDLVAGNNLSKNLSVAEIDSMESTYAPILSALKNNRPDKAFALISAITPDETLVTSEDKAEYLALFAQYGII